MKLLWLPLDEDHLRHSAGSVPSLPRHAEPDLSGPTFQPVVMTSGLCSLKTMTGISQKRHSLSVSMSAWLSEYSNPASYINLKKRFWTRPYVPKLRGGCGGAAFRR